MDFSPEKLRSHWEALCIRSSDIQGVLKPLRAQLDAIVGGDTKLSVKAANAREAELREKIKALQFDLAPIDMERAAVARALGGQTGELPAAAKHLS